MRNYPSYARDIVVRGDALSASPLVFFAQKGIQPEIVRQLESYEHARKRRGSGLAQKGIQPEIVRQLENYEHARKRWLASEDKRQPVGGTSRGR